MEDSERVAPIVKGAPPPRPSGSPPGRPRSPNDVEDKSEPSTVMIVREQPEPADGELKPSSETSQIRPKMTMIPVADKAASITPILKMIPEDEMAASTPLHPKVTMIPSEEE